MRTQSTTINLPRARMSKRFWFHYRRSRAFGDDPWGRKRRGSSRRQKRARIRGRNK